MRHIDLFSGIGGFALAARWTWGEQYENVGHSEVEEFPCKVYHRHFPESECLGDITKIEWQEGQADIITGGFPCQPHSIAGKRQASADDRDLWSECARAVRVVRPDWALFENVPGLLVSERGRFFNRVLTDMAEAGYNVEWYTIGAWEMGAPHKRNRIWIVAYPIGQRCKDEQEGRGETVSDKERIVEAEEQGGEFQQCGVVESTIAPRQDDTNASNERLSGSKFRGTSEQVKGASRSTTQLHQDASDTEETERQFARRTWAGRDGLADNAWQQPWIEVATRLCRVDDGVSRRVDRLRGLGNSIVPQVAWVIFEAIKQYDKANGG